MIEEVRFADHLDGPALPSILDSEVVEFSNSGLPGDGGSDGDMGGNLGIQQTT